MKSILLSMLFLYGQIISIRAPTERCDVGFWLTHRIYRKSFLWAFFLDRKIELQLRFYWIIIDQFKIFSFDVEEISSIWYVQD